MSVETKRGQAYLVVLMELWVREKGDIIVGSEVAGDCLDAGVVNSVLGEISDELGWVRLTESKKGWEVVVDLSVD